MAKKTNHLTTESNRIWAQATRDAKCGRHEPHRDRRRCFEWAAWRLEQSGVSLPDDAKPLLTGNRVEFRRTVKPPPTEGRPSWRLPPLPRVEVLGTVEIPPHCLPVEDAEAWLVAHLGAPMHGLLEGAA
jgi:hypothetical protein